VDVDDTPIPRDVLIALSQVPEVLKETREKAADIARDARRLAPKRTGNLRRRGIGIERMKDEKTGQTIYGVGWTPAGFYGWMVEAGTEHSPPRPHLVPAAIKHGAVEPEAG
jgi:HK97 gp10 family phage protein